MTLKQLLPIGLCAVGGIGLGSALAQPGSTAAAPPVAAVHAHDDGQLCGGSHPALQVELVPTLHMDTDGREQVEFSLELGNNDDRAASVGYAVDVVDADGRAQAPRKVAPISRVASGDLRAEAVRTPLAGPDGYFVARVVAASSDGITADAQTVEQYYRRHNGKIELLSANEWMAQSGIMEGRSLRAPVMKSKGGLR